MSVDIIIEATNYDFGPYRKTAERVLGGLLHFKYSDNEKLRKNEAYTQRSYVIGLFLVAAANYCSKNNIKPNSEKCDDIFFEEMYDVIEDLTYATNFSTFRIRDDLILRN